MIADIPSSLRDTRNHGITRIVVPCYSEEVAPLFGACRHFRVWEFEDGVITDYREIAVYVSNGMHRLRLVRKLGTHVLICNGIEDRYRLMLETDGIQVVDGIVGLATDAAFGYLAGRIRAVRHDDDPTVSEVQPHTADLVEWTSELFVAHGWVVRRPTTPSMFPIDLIAKVVCPICGQSIRVAICCGAHAFKVKEELLELRRVTSNGFDARVYVHQQHPAIQRMCKEYEIEQIDPSRFVNPPEKTDDQHPIPPLLQHVHAKHRAKKDSTIAIT